MIAVTTLAKLEYSEFKQFVPEKFTKPRQQRYKDFQQKVGEVLQRYRDVRLPSTNDKEARHTKWQDWFGQIKFDEDAELISEIDDSTASEIMAGRSRAIYHLAVYYRFHSLIDDLKWADEIDTFIFGAPLRTRGTEVFIKDVFDLSPWLNTENSEAIFHYSHGYMEIYGRGRERQILQSFLSKDRSFNWLQLAGDGGQGKSRLALELVQEAKAHDWDAGFINLEGLELLARFGAEWHPSRPTLIVLDYVMGLEPNLKPVFQDLARRRTDFREPVRLLLLERQPWNQSGLQNIPRWTEGGEFISGPTNLAGRADWFLNLCERYDGGDLGLADSRFQDDGLVHLRNLELEDLVSIVRSELKRNQCVSLMSDVHVGEELQRIDGSGRPLFAHFFAKSVIDGFYEQGFTEADLLTEILKRERRIRWSHSLKSSGDNPRSEACELGEDSIEMRLALVATIVDGLRCTKTVFATEQSAPNANVLKNAVALNGGPSGTQLGLVPGMKPDILGEWFVLYSFNCGLIDADEVIQAAWRADPQKAAAFYVRIAQDFPSYQVTLKVLGTAPPNVHGEAALRSVVGQLASTIVASEAQEFPQLLYHELEQAAQNGDANAMHVFGNFLLTGQCVKEDKKVGFEFTKRAAELSGVGALHNLAVCYENGFGTERNIDLSLETYGQAVSAGSRISILPYANLLLSPDMGAEHYDAAFRILDAEMAAGNADAMFMLAGCHALGRGTVVDEVKAFEYCRMAALAGHLDAIANLGVRLENGRGTKADLEQAKLSYLRAALGGHPRAMYMIADYYAEHERTAENFHKALGWYKKSAQAGYVKAMTNYAHLLLENGKTQEVFIEATMWLSRAATHGDALAMANLGVCLIQGKGVPVDTRLGAEWTLRSAEAGNMQSMFAMSYLYKNGIGVEVDEIESEDWHVRATMGSTQHETDS